MSAFLSLWGTGELRSSEAATDGGLTASINLSFTIEFAYVQLENSSPLCLCCFREVSMCGPCLDNVVLTTNPQFPVNKIQTQISPITTDFNLIFNLLIRLIVIILTERIDSPFLSIPVAEFTSVINQCHPFNILFKKMREYHRTNMFGDWKPHGK